MIIRILFICLFVFSVKAQTIILKDYDYKVMSHIGEDELVEDYAKNNLIMYEDRVEIFATGHEYTIKMEYIVKDIFEAEVFGYPATIYLADVKSDGMVHYYVVFDDNELGVLMSISAMSFHFIDLENKERALELNRGYEEHFEHLTEINDNRYQY